MSTTVYCYRHKSAERLTGREAEDLLQGMSSLPAPSGSSSWCPVVAVAALRRDQLAGPFLEESRRLRLEAARSARG